MPALGANPTSAIKIKCIITSRHSSLTFKSWVRHSSAVGVVVCVFGSTFPHITIQPDGGSLCAVMLVTKEGLSFTGRIVACIVEENQTRTNSLLKCSLFEAVHPRLHSGPPYREPEISYFILVCPTAILPRFQRLRGPEQAST